MKRHLGWILVLAIAVLWSIPTAAQSRCASGLCGDSSGSSGVKLSARNERFVQRASTPSANSLHLLAGIERPGSLDLVSALDQRYPGIQYLRIDSPFFGTLEAVTAVAGVAYGITREIEVGAMILPLQLSPEFRYTDPKLWGTLSSSSDIGSAGIRLAIDLPVGNQSESAFLEDAPILSLSVPLTLAFGESAMFEFAPVVRGAFGTEIGWLFEVPYRLSFNVTDEVFFGVNSGVVLPEFNGDGLVMPLGGFFGYTVADDGDPIVDISLSFRFPLFLTALNEYQEPITDALTLGVGANAFFYF